VGVRLVSLPDDSHMPLPRLKLTPAEIKEQERKAKQKLKRKAKKHAGESRATPPDRTLFTEGIGHIDEMADQEILNAQRRVDEESYYESRLDFEDTDPPPSADRETGVSRVPGRWRSRSRTPQNDLDIDIMDDQTFSEWVLKGHYRMGDTIRVGNINFIVTDQDAFQKRKRRMEEYERRKQEKVERHRKETRERKEREQREEDEERNRQREEMEHEEERKQGLLQEYNERWLALLAPSHPKHPALGSLFFTDIPWPSFIPPLVSSEVDPTSIKEFVLTTPWDLETEQQPSLRDLLRPHFLRFHPDKFIGKIMPLVVDIDEERTAVEEGVVAVMHCLNTIAETRGK
jgi:hypothetical protein